MRMWKRGAANVWDCARIRTQMFYGHSLLCICVCVILCAAYLVLFLIRPPIFYYRLPFCYQFIILLMLVCGALIIFFSSAVSLFVRLVWIFKFLPMSATVSFHIQSTKYSSPELLFFFGVYGLLLLFPSKFVWLIAYTCIIMAGVIPCCSCMSNVFKQAFTIRSVRLLCMYFSFTNCKSLYLNGCGGIHSDTRVTMDDSGSAHSHWFGIGMWCMCMHHRIAHTTTIYQIVRCRTHTHAH